MKELFGDTYYFIALQNRTDSAHAKSLQVSRSSSGTVVTTIWVLTEVADALCDRDNRATCAKFIDAVRVNPRILVLEAAQKLFEAGMDLYRERDEGLVSNGLHIV